MAETKIFQKKTYMSHSELKGEGTGQEFVGIKKKQGPFVSFFLLLLLLLLKAKNVYNKIVLRIKFNFINPLTLYSFENLFNKHR